MTNMASNIEDRVPGTTSVSEVVRDWLKFKNIDEFNESFIQEVAQGMVLRSGAKNMTEAEISGAADAKEMSYRQNFAKFWKARDFEVDERASDTAWQKIRAKAAQRYAQLRMQATTPATPEEQELIEVTEGIEIIPDELPDSLKPEQWADWRTKPLDNDTIGKLNFEFANALSRKLKSLTPGQVQDVQRIYEDIVADMYKITYPGEENPREQIGRALALYWKAVFNAAERLAPATSLS